MVDAPAIADLLALADDGARLLLATASPTGEPYLTVVDSLGEDETSMVRVTGWFCPRTLANVDANPRIALLVAADGVDGFQLTGDVVSAEQLAMLDGYEPDLEAAGPVPQVRWSFRVAVDEVFAFSDRSDFGGPAGAAGP